MRTQVHAHTRTRTPHRTPLVLSKAGLKRGSGFLELNAHAQWLNHGRPKNLNQARQRAVATLCTNDLTARRCQWHGPNILGKSDTAAPATIVISRDSEGRKQP